MEEWLLKASALLQDEPDPISTSADAASARQLGPREGRRAAAQHTSTPEARPVRSRLARQTGVAGNAVGAQGLHLSAAKCRMTITNQAMFSSATKP